ncbi:LLM class flavin-dependent oxidoreductase [Streptomyces sp. NPDC051840]|uniref:LLM class flavin-dependent oxidoreductase n=1 Tax=Streptomyces sp. NPDC051840 TaxID=3154752 RepID=UPI00341767E7
MEFPLRVRLSVLDQSPIGEGFGHADALRHTVESAKAADALGYHRYWLAEHHRSQSFAGNAPEVLAGLVLENTERLRVGTGGILLPRYQPDKVAEAMGLPDRGRVQADGAVPGGHRTAGWASAWEGRISPRCSCRPTGTGCWVR